MFNAFQTLLGSKNTSCYSRSTKQGKKQTEWQIFFTLLQLFAWASKSP